jgi:hypothetical protein
MKFSNSSKVLFDLVMLIILALVFCARTGGVAFHECLGVSIYLFFIIHLAYNYKWIVNVGKKLFDKNYGLRFKFMFTLNFLLLLTFIIVGLSGIMISRVIFNFEAPPIWRPLHAISASISIILLAVHIGLHGKMIIHVARTKIKLPIIKKISLTMLVLLLSAGIYGDVISKTQSFQNLLTRGPKYETALGLFERCINFLSGSSERTRSMMTEARNGSPEQPRSRMAETGSGSPEQVRGQMAERGSGSPGQARGQMAERGNGSPEQARGQMPQLGNREDSGMRRNDTGEMGRQQPPFSLSNLLISISNYIAFILVCSLIVFFLDNLLKRIYSKVARKSIKGGK